MPSGTIPWRCKRPSCRGGGGENPCDLTRHAIGQGQVALRSCSPPRQPICKPRLTVIKAQANRYSDTVGLFQALGGGWWNRPAPPHVAQPQAWLASVTGVQPDPVAIEYPGATQNEARCSLGGRELGEIRTGVRGCASEEMKLRLAALACGAILLAGRLRACPGCFRRVAQRHPSPP